MHGWSQERLAEICGVHRTYMGHVERGEKNVSLSTILRVSNALGIRVAELFKRTQKSPEKENPPAPNSAPKTNHVGAVTNAFDVNQVLNELQVQRRTLRQVVRDLTTLLTRGGKRTR
jgi:transcriptional regulator with XRE-family HTH domain